MLVFTGVLHDSEKALAGVSCLSLLGLHCSGSLWFVFGSFMVCLTFRRVRH